MTSLARLPAWAVLVLVWLPLGVAYPLAMARLAENPLAGAVAGLRSVAIGGLLVAGVWWLSGRLRWTDQSGAGFYLTHVAAGLVYAFLWWTTAIAADALTSPATVLGSLGEALVSRFLIWNLMLGMVVYGLTAGVSYALRAADRARKEQVRAAQSQALATRAQLTALQAQLNPHFLFNTLHSLSVLVRRDPAVAEDAIDRLGAILRYALDHGSRDDVTLREEVAFADDYLAIEQIRLGERLVVQREIDESALPRRVPPFCLQPLIENAVRHGLNPRSSGGTLTITIRNGPDRVTLAVRDNGVGADPASPALASGHGVTSLRTRLAAWDDGDATLALETEPGAGFTATVTIPGTPADASAAFPAARAVAEPVR